MGKRRAIAQGMPDIGELRARLEHRRDSQGWALVRDWAEQAWEADRQQFEEIWVHYLLDHVARWPARVCDAPRRWLMRATRGGFGPLRLARRIVLEERRLTPEDWRLLPALAGAPEVAQIQILSADKLTLSAEEIAALCRPGAWPALRALGCGGLMPEGALWQSALLAQLDALWIGRVGAAAGTCAHAALPRLKRLGLLAAGGAGPSALQLQHQLFSEGALPALESLELSYGALAREADDWQRYPVRAAALREVELRGAYGLRSSEVFGMFGPTLEALGLAHVGPADHGTRLRDEELVALLQSATPPSPLKRLSLQGAHIGERGLRALRESGRLGTLERLELSQCQRLGVGAMEQLSRTTHLTALRELDLSRTSCNGRGARWLARWPLLGQLTLLDLRGTEVGERDAAQLREAAGPGLTLLCDAAPD